jgi:hypothetical protein
MTLRLAALVKRVAELCKASLKACHYIKEFTLQQIHPLGRREKLAYECPRLADPSREAAVGKIFSLTFCILMVYFLNMICSMSCITLTWVEIDQFMARLFDKDPPTPRPARVPPPFSSDNLPPEVRVSPLSDILYLHCLTNLSYL